MIIEKLKQHLTISQIAVEVGRSDKAVYAWMSRGVAWPARKQVKALASKYGIETSDEDFEPQVKEAS